MTLVVSSQPNKTLKFFSSNLYKIRARPFKDQALRFSSSKYSTLYRPQLDLVGLRSFLSFLKGRGRGGGPGCLCIGIWNWIGFYRAEFVLGLSALWTQVDYETLLYIVVRNLLFHFAATLLIISQRSGNLVVQVEANMACRRGLPIPYVTSNCTCYNRPFSLTSCQTTAWSMNDDPLTHSLQFARRVF